MKNQMRKQQVMNEMETILSLFAFLQCSQNCTIPGEGYIGSERTTTAVTDQHAANQPLTQKKDNCHREIFEEFTSTVWELEFTEGLQWLKAQSSRLDYHFFWMWQIVDTNIVSAINQCQMYLDEFLWQRCKTLPAINRYEYTHTTPTILELFILFCLLLIILFQMWVNMTRLEGNGQPLQRVGKSTNDQNGPKRKSKNKRNTEITQDETSVWHRYTATN